MTIIDSSASTIGMAGVPSMIGVSVRILSAGISRYRDSRHTSKARPPAMMTPSTLTHIGTILPLNVTSQPKTSLRTCTSATRTKIPTAIVVNGFFITILGCLPDYSSFLIHKD